MKTASRASGTRDAEGILARKIAAWKRSTFLRRFLDAIPTSLLVLNGNRQIVAANRAFLELLGTGEDVLLGKRPGEAVQCIRTTDGPEGCGTGRHCEVCGTVNTILGMQLSGDMTSGESRLLVNTPDGVSPLELRVTASPFPYEGEDYCVLSIEDLSQPKRLAVLQRVFFHDIANTAGCIHGLARSLPRSQQPGDEVIEQIDAMSLQLIDEVRAYRELVHAENGELAVLPQSLRTSELLEEIRAQWSRHEVGTNRCLRIRALWDGVIVSDRQLLKRVLGNMIKNALEATPEGGLVTLDCSETGQNVAFAVHNTEVMPEDVQLQVFQRSFSTKNELGRGIGTHSMRLLGERYLGGCVSFHSAAPEGTTFVLTVPKNLSSVEKPASSGRM